MASVIDDVLPDSNVVTALGTITFFSALAAFGVDIQSGPVNPLDYQEQGQALLPIMVLFSYLVSDRVYGDMDNWESASLLLPGAIALSMGYVDPVYSMITDAQPLSGYVLIAMSVHAFHSLIVKG